MRYLKSYKKFNESVDTKLDIEEIFKSYLESALFFTTNMDYNSDDNSDDDDDDDENYMIRKPKAGEFLSSTYTFDNMDTNLRIQLYNEVKNFVEENYDTLLQSELTESEIGHTIWLSQNGHGSSFQDYSNKVDWDILDKLDDSAKKMGEVHLYVGDDNMIYGLGKENESFQVDDIDDDLLEFDIPTWALSALIDGDFSGLEDDAEKKLNTFIQKTVDEYGNAIFMSGGESEEPSFRWRNDIDGVLGADVITLYLSPTDVKGKIEDIYSGIAKEELSILDIKTLNYIRKTKHNYKTICNNIKNQISSSNTELTVAQNNVLKAVKINEDLFSFVGTDYKSGLAPEDEKKLDNFLNKKLEVDDLPTENELPIENVEEIELTTNEKKIIKRFKNI